MSLTPDQLAGFHIFGPLLAAAALLLAGFGVQLARVVGRA